MSIDLSEELRRFEEEIANVPKFVPAFIPSQVTKNVSRTTGYTGNQIVALPTPLVKNLEPEQQQPKVSTNLKSPAKKNAIPLGKNDASMSMSSNDKSAKKSKKSKKSKSKNDEHKSSLLFNSSFTSAKHKHEENKKKLAKNRKLLRTAGGTVWEDITLAEWTEDDYRIFCGDLGNDVTDELLTRHFCKYPSFLKARVIRDRRSNKSKGYGFVSFKDPVDFSKAMKEMNGRYIGSRPIKLKKSCWKNRSIDVARKREKERSHLISLLQTGLNKPIA